MEPKIPAGRQADPTEGRLEPDAAQAPQTEAPRQADQTERPQQAEAPAARKEPSALKRPAQKPAAQKPAAQKPAVQEPRAAASTAAASTAAKTAAARKAAPSKATATAKATPAKATPSKAPTTPKATSAKAAPSKAPTTATATSAKAAPANATPAKATPNKTARAKAVPAKAAPAKATPGKAKAAPAKAAPAKTIPAKAAPANAAPAEAAASEAVAKKAAPTKNATPKKIATVPVPDEPAKVPTPVWERIKANPRYAPELLATAAVDTLGTQAGGYARWLAATYPHATPDSIARYVSQRYATRAGYAALAGTLLGGLAEAAALVWAHARLVLLIAAAYGHDPADPRRVPELLVLLRVHPDLESANTALEGAGAGHTVSGWLRVVAVPLGGRRLPSRLLPGAGLLLGAITNSATTEGVARRAVAHYRGRALQGQERDVPLQQDVPDE